MGRPHYVTTDAALAHHGLTDQPITTITVVVSRVRRSFAIDPTTTLRPVTVDEHRIRGADAYPTTIDGSGIRIASREQAVVGALAEPRWMTYGDLLPEVLAGLSDDEVERTAARVLAPDDRGGPAARLPLGGGATPTAGETRPRSASQSGPTPPTEPLPRSLLDALAHVWLTARTWDPGSE